jgi:hypothetical protein
MKKVTLIFLSVALLLGFAACATPQTTDSTAQEDALFPMPDSGTGLWGVVDREGNVVVQPEYSYIGAFDEKGYASVILADQPDIGYIDTKGNYYSIHEHTPDQVLAYGENGLAPKKDEDGYYGYVNEAGEWVIQPEYEGAELFQNGLACVTYTVPGDMVPSRAFINEKGTEVVPPEKWANYPEFAQNGLANVETGNDYMDATAALRYRLYAYYYGLNTVNKATYEKILANPDAYQPKNKGRNFLVDNYFNEEDSISDGSEYPTYLEAVYYPMDFYCGYMDKTGNIRIPLQFYRALPFSKNGFALVGDIWSEGLFGIIDANGEFVVKPKFLDVTGFDKNGMSLAQENSAEGLWGVINEKGEWVVKPQYKNDEETTRIGRMDYDYWYEYEHLQNKDGLYGYIDESYDYFIRPQFKQACPFAENGHAWVQDKAGLWGMIDKTGAYVIQPSYKNYRGVYNGLYLVQDAKGLWGYIDDKEAYVISPR